MRWRKLIILFSLLLFFIAAALFFLKRYGAAAGPVSVRVAALQLYSEMGETENNSARLERLVRDAAGKGAKIIVTPECALQGYCYPNSWFTWNAGESNEDSLPAGKYAESIPGASTKRFAALAKELGVYLCLGMMEKADDKFYNSQVLLSPQGEIAAHHRKKSLWPPGDGAWCSSGELPAQVVETPYGRLGMMICFDFRRLTKMLHKEKADIVLYSVGWYGPNEKNWFSNLFPRDYVIPYGFHVVSANWAAPAGDEGWPGCGYSCVLSKSGEVLAMNREPHAEVVIIADLPIIKGDKK